jgi:alpha-L-glutamate ligase-like protein
MFTLIKALNQKGVLGINRRNAQYTLWHNKRSLYPLVDDKLRTKELALKAGIRVPELYGVLEVSGQVGSMSDLVAEHSDFVIKPAHGSGGEGILVIIGRSKDRFRTASGALLHQEQVQHHVHEALSGLFSLGGQPDKVIIEYRVQVDPVFQGISYQGVPDIRVIVFWGVPVMAMVRLPTSLSGGKANLHQGAIGAGVDLAGGKTLTAVWRNEVVSEHPDTGNSVENVAIPGWSDLLQIAAGASELTGLGYLGVDLVLDKNLGPMVLEMNARPGLNIQIANRAGLLARLQKVENSISTLTGLEQRVEFAQHNFASEL